MKKTLLLFLTPLLLLATDWDATLKKDYNLTNEQIQSMKDKGLSGEDMARVSRLSQKSGKTLDEVMTLRVDNKMGWGRIAKDLGVHPKEIGHAISDAKQADRAERHAEKMEKHHEKKASKAEKGHKHGKSK